MTTITFKDNQSEHFTLIQYPDGQKSINLHIGMLNIKELITIKCRIKNFSELEVLSCLIAALRRHDYHINKIQFIYLFGMRSDRSFNLGQPNYFRDVVAPIINDYMIPGIEILAPHSDLSSESLYSYEGSLDYLIIIHDSHEIIKSKDLFLIPADENAHKCHRYLTSRINQEEPFHFEKKRSGEYGDVHIYLKEENLELLKKNNSPFLIYDDLCDGGATFIEIAKFLRKNGVNNDLYLFIVHGLFTKGLDGILQYYSHIITTNSYQEIEHPKLTQIKVI